MARSLRSKLQALEQSTGHKTQGLQEEENEQGLSLQALGFVYEDEGAGGFWHRRTACDLLNFYGRVRFGDILQRDLSLLARACKVSPEDPGWRGPPDAMSLRFYDTETTGLGTGAGTLPFLHAVGQIEGDEWVVHQYFLNDFQEEPALLAAIMNRHFQEGTLCVTFNGKTFDWPLLQNRLILYGMTPPRTPVAQMDLLHPCRRLWRRSLPRVTLGQLELELLHVARKDDLPGREAPARYFAYIHDRVIAGIRPVLDHNAADVSALLALCVVVADVLNGRHVAESAGEYAALASWYSEWQDYDLAESCLMSAVQCPDATWREYWLASLHYKRLNQWSQACNLWETMVENYRWSTVPMVELAKYYEHHVRDYGHALHWTEAALLRCRQEPLLSRSLMGQGPQNSHSEAMDDVLRALFHRKARIERKLAAGPGP